MTDRPTSKGRDQGKALINAGTDRLTSTVQRRKDSLLYVGVGVALALAGAGTATAATVADSASGQVKAASAEATARPVTAPAAAAGQHAEAADRAAAVLVADSYVMAGSYAAAGHRPAPYPVARPALPAKHDAPHSAMPHAAPVPHTQHTPASRANAPHAAAPVPRTQHTPASGANAPHAAAPAPRTQHTPAPRANTPHAAAPGPRTQRTPAPHANTPHAAAPDPLAHPIAAARAAAPLAAAPDPLAHPIAAARAAAPVAAAPDPLAHPIAAARAVARVVTAPDPLAQHSVTVIHDAPQAVAQPGAAPHVLPRHTVGRPGPAGAVGRRVGTQHASADKHAVTWQQVSNVLNNEANPAAAAHHQVPYADRLSPVGVSGPQSWMPLSQAQVANARTIVKQALAKNMGVRSAVIAVATAMQESQLVNINYGTYNSLGLFQQQYNMGWGTPAQIMNPRYAADAFLTALQQYQASDPGWATQPLWQAAQGVQKSAFPYAYAKWEAQAASLVKQIATHLGPATT